MKKKEVGRVREGGKRAELYRGEDNMRGSGDEDWKEENDTCDVFNMAHIMQQTVRQERGYVR